MSDFIEYAGWTVGETYMVIGVPLILGGGVLLSWIVGHFSDRWSNRIAGMAILSLFAWMLMAASMWDRTWPA